jgi:TrmH family RNA methyltransferase
VTDPLSERSATVTDAVKLHRRAERAAAGRFLAEGPNLVEAAARRGVVERVFVTDAAAQRHQHLLDGLPDGLPDGPVVVRVSDRAMKALSETVTPPGLVAVCRQPQPGLDEVLAGGPALVVVAAEISDPGNAGTLIRLADAMGAAAVIFTGDAVDPYNGKCVRSSAGSILSVPVLCEPDTVTVIERLRAAGLQVLATTLDGEVTLDDIQGELSRRTAWLFGPEAHGLSRQSAQRADRRVVIPMSGDVDSLNVAAAAAICLYQSAYARRGSGLG